MTTRVIKKAVFPVAGLGTRFLPATKANPKEMLPIVDKPLIQYAVEEAIAAGFTELVFITSSSKHAIEDHFDSNYELESKLEARSRYDLLQAVRNIIPRGVYCSYVRQYEPLGLGHAILSAQHIVGNEPFAVLLADDLIDDAVKNNRSTAHCMKKMVAMYEKTKSSVIAVEQVALEDTSKYGIVEFKRDKCKQLKLSKIVEKPMPHEAPSNYAVIGRYILTPDIFNQLSIASADQSGEIQLTDGIASLLKDENVFAYVFEGRRYDCGSKLGYITATIDYALKHQEIGDSFKKYLERYIPSGQNVREN